jgi:hypothetical protein
MINYMFGSVIPDTNQLIHQLIKTRYAKRAINSFFVLILSFVIRTILYSILSLIIMFDNIYIDFTTQCVISIMLCTTNNYIQGFTEHFSDDLYKITRYIINNYSEENYRRWKNYITFSSLFSMFVYFCFVEINSFIIRIYIMQYAVCFFFFEIKENKRHYMRKILSIKKEKKIYYITDNDVPNTDFIIIDKKPIPQNASSEFDLVKRDELKKCQSEFELI